MSRQIVGMSMCSGIGAPEVAAPWVDWRLASEIEPFPRAVLQQRFGYRLPEDQNQGEPLLWGDMTEITPDLLRERGLPLPDLIVAGTPCQAFSVAGARKGLEDARGNLTLAFVEILHDLAAARPDGKLAALWENVPGVLSDKGNAFGCFLGGIVGAMDALPRPAWGSWPREGMVEGPRARAAWCVLDSQWFGVAQRRERVFVVVDFGNCVDPAAVLLEPDRLRGDSPPRRETGQGLAKGVEFGSSGGGFTDVNPTLDTRAKDGPVRNQLAGAALVPAWPAEVASTLNAAFGDKQGLEDQHINGGAPLFVPVAHSLRGEGFDASEDGTGRGTPIVPVSFVQNTRDEVRLMGGDGQIIGALPAEPGAKQQCYVAQPVSIAMRGREDGAQMEIGDDCAFTLRASTGGGDKPHVFAPVAFAHQAAGKQTTLGFSDDGTCQTISANQTPAVAFAIQERATCENPNAGPDGAGFRGDGAAYTLEARTVPQAVATPWAVRRLTPTECARLQAFPDDHTRIEWRGKPADQCPDGPQYKALGNSMTTNVVRWIMDRMRISMEEQRAKA